AGNAGAGKAGQQQHDHGEASQRLRREDAPWRTDGHQQVAPRAEPVFDGEYVAGHQRGEQRQYIRAGEAEHHQRASPAGRVHPAAEHGVSWQRALPADFADQQRRHDHGAENQKPEPPLGEQLDQLETVTTGDRNSPAGGGRGSDRCSHWSSSGRSVRARKADSSGEITGASSRTANPALTSRTTSSSRAVTSARTMRASPPCRRATPSAR